MTLLFLIGAGASYGSKSIKPYATPIGNALFNHLKDCYKDSWGLINNEVFEKSFENCMGKIWDDFS